MNRILDGTLVGVCVSGLNCVNRIEAEIESLPIFHF